MKELNPDDGHIFTFTHSCRGSYSVVGEPGHHFESEDPKPLEATFQVQAWSLKEALEKALEMPFAELMVWKEEEDEATQES